MRHSSAPIQYRWNIILCVCFPRVFPFFCIKWIPKPWPLIIAVLTFHFSAGWGEINASEYIRCISMLAIIRYTLSRLMDIHGPPKWLLLVWLPADNAQYELQLWSLINIPWQKKKTTEIKETCVQSLAPFWTHCSSGFELYLLHLLILVRSRTNRAIR